MNLHEARVVRRDRRNHRALERPGRDDHAVRLDRAVGCLDDETRLAGIAHDLLHLDAGTDRRVELARVRFEVVGDLVFRCERIGIEAVEFEAGETVVPRGAVRDQRIPATRAPALGDAAALEHEMRYAQLAQVLAHGHAGLTGAHDERID